MFSPVVVEEENVQETKAVLAPIEIEHEVVHHQSAQVLTMSIPVPPPIENLSKKMKLGSARKEIETAPVEEVSPD